jgi:hypothetical protein
MPIVRHRLNAPLRATNPIPGGAGWHTPRERRVNVRNEPNLGRKCTRRRNRMCETKAIWGSPAGVRGPIVQNKAKPGQDGTFRGRRIRQGPIVQNEPNSTLAGWEGRRWGQSCKTNLIPGRPGWDGTPGTAGDCAKQAQLPWSVWIGQVLGRKGVMMIWHREGPWQNKAKLGQDGAFGEQLVAEADRAKQSQSRQSLVGRGHGDAGQSCETDPIRGRDTGTGGPRRAKRTQFWAVPGGSRPEGRGTIMPNEPNSPAAGYPTIPLFHHSSIPAPTGGSGTCRHDRRRTKQLRLGSGSGSIGLS